MRKITLLLMLVLAATATGAFAETIYLKDGGVVRGRIVQEEANTIMIETGDSWQRIDKSAIEIIRPDAPQTSPASPPAVQQGTEGAAGPSAYSSGSVRQQSSRRDSGWYLGFEIPYNMIDGDFDGRHMPDVDPGIGIGLILGYRFDPHFGLEIDWAATAHNSEGADIGMGEFSLNAKVSFLPKRAAHPFLFAGVGSFTLGDESLMFGGTGYNIGAGLDFQVAERNTIGIAVIRKIITYDEILKSDVPLTLPRDINGDTTSIRFDFTHQF